MRQRKHPPDRPSPPWAADLSERAELVRLLLLPEGVRFDLVTRQIATVRPRASFLAPLRLAWNDWRTDGDSWLARDAPPAATVPAARSGT